VTNGHDEDLLDFFEAILHEEYPDLGWSDINILVIFRKVSCSVKWWS